MFSLPVDLAALIAYPIHRRCSKLLPTSAFVRSDTFLSKRNRGEIVPKVIYSVILYSYAFVRCHLMSSLFGTHADEPIAFARSFSSIFLRAARIISSRLRCRLACLSFLSCDHAFCFCFSFSGSV